MAVQKTGSKQRAPVWLPVTAEDVARKRRGLILKVAVAVLVLVSGAWFTYQRSMRPQEARRSYGAGVLLYHSARYQQAILNFTRAINMNSGFTDAYRMRGKAYSDDGNLTAAIADFSKVTELSPRDSEAFTDRALCYLGKKEYQHTIADATTALSLNPKQARAYNLRGTALRALGDPRKALDDFTKAVDADPDLDNYFQRASTYQLLGDHQHAVEDLTKAIEIAPDQPHAYFARSKSLTALGDTTDARDDFAHGRKLDGW